MSTLCKAIIKRLKIVSLLAFCLQINYGSIAQQKEIYDTGHLYTADQVKADFNYTRTLLEKVHPSLYRYTSKDSLNFYFEQAAAHLTHPMTELAFWQVLQTAVASIRSGHTEVNLSRGFERWTKEHDCPILPFFPVIKDDKLYIGNYDRSLRGQLNAGDEILAINDEPASRIIANLRALAVGDGYNNTFRDYQIDVYFGPMYNYLHPVSTAYQLSVRHNGATIKVNVPMVNFAVYRSALKQDTTYGTLKRNQEYRLYYRGDLPSTAIFQADLFSYDDYENAHRSMFKKLKDDGIKNLVVDIRGNNGGSEDIAIDLLKYLVNQPYTMITEKTSRVDGDIFMNQVRRYNKAKSPEAMDQLIAGISHVNTPFKQTVYQPDPLAFKGRIYVLTDEGTFSVASLLAVTLKTLSHATIIGRETGGGFTGCDGYYEAAITLPNTKVKLSIPLYYGHSVANTADKGRGLMPDAPVEHTFGPNRGKNDPMMLKVKELTDVGQ